MMLPNPFHQVLHSLRHPGVYPFFPLRSAYVAQYALWQLELLRTLPPVAPGEPKLTVILLSYNRVRNMQPIVRGLLRSGVVERIIVSNNNPSYRIGEWISLRDERLELVDQPHKTAPGIRFEFARKAPGSYFLSVDDDVFLTPRQVQRLFQELRANPRMPHGIQGENYVGMNAPPGPGQKVRRIPWDLGLQRAERETDVLNCVYAFTREHVEEMFRLAGQLGRDVATLGNGEDILLSCSGQGRPRIHDLGRVLMCLSAHQLGVATYRTREHFFQEREELLFSLRALQDKRALRPAS